MKKKIVLSIIIISVTILVSMCGYFFIVEIESEIPKHILEGIKIDSKEIMSRKVFIISPKDEENKNVILYFHGGAYMAEMTDKHWEFLQKICLDSKSTIIVPDYPLTAKYTYKDVLNMSETVYKEIIDKEDNNFIMMGDSAGGGLALGLEERLAINSINLPSKTILISPWLDTTMSNPKIKEIQPYDKELNKFKLSIAGLLYSRWINENEKYFVNPINGDLSKLKNITIYTGTHDILNPDCHLLQERAQTVGGDIQIKEYPTASHIWVINNNDYLANQAYEDLLQDVKKSF